MSKLQRWLANIALFTVLLFSLAFCVFVIDLTGTMMHLWVGSAWSVAITAWWHVAGLWLFETSTDTLVWFGLSQQTAELSTMLTGAIVMLVLAAWAIRFLYRDLMRSFGCKVDSSTTSHT